MYLTYLYFHSSLAPCHEERQKQGNRYFAIPQEHIYGSATPSGFDFVGIVTGDFVSLHPRL